MAEKPLFPKDYEMPHLVEDEANAQADSDGASRALRKQPSRLATDSATGWGAPMSQRGYACVALHMPKTAMNVGSALRAAYIYDARLIVTSGRRYHPVSSDTVKAFRHVPFLQAEDVFDVIPYDCVPVAVDILPGAVPLPRYHHPERAFYVFGPEDGTLGERVVSRCRDTIAVPTRHCMNLAATVNVVLYDRLAKAFSKTRESDQPLSALSMVG